MNADRLKRNPTHPINIAQYNNHLAEPGKRTSNYSNPIQSNKSVIYLLSFKNEKDEDMDPIANISPRKKKMATVKETIPISIIKKSSMTKKRVTIAGNNYPKEINKAYSLNKKKRLLDLHGDNVISYGTKSSFHSMSKFHTNTNTNISDKKLKENDIEMNLDIEPSSYSEEYDDYNNSHDDDMKKDNSKHLDKECKRNDDNHSIDATEKSNKLQRKNQLDINLLEATHYTRILQLKKEIQNEKEKWKMKSDMHLNEVIDHLNHQLLDKNMIIEKLNKLNIQQMRKLAELSKDADIKLKKVRYHPIALMSRNLNRNPLKHELTIQDSIKLKEKQLKNTFSLATILTKENDFLKSKYYRLGDRQSLMTLGNQSNEYKVNVTSLELRIKELRQLLEEHSKCDKKHDDYFNVIQSMKEDVKKIQLSNMNLIKRIKEVDQRHSKALAYSQKKKHTKTFSMINSISHLKTRNQLCCLNQFNTINLTSSMQVNTSLVNNNNNSSTINTNNANKSTINLTTTFNNSLEVNDKKTMQTRFEQILTQKEIEIIKNFFNDKKNEYDNVVRRIIILENLRKSMINQHKADVKSNQLKIKELEDDLKYVSTKQKEMHIKRKLYETQIKVCTNEVKCIKRKVTAMKENLMAINPNLIIRDATIKSLQSELVLIKTRLYK